MREAYLLSTARTPVAKAFTGRLRTVRADEFGALVLREAVRRAAVDTDEIDDVILGCAMPEGAQGYNLARVAACRAGFPDSVPGVTINRFCTSGLEAIALGAQRIMSGMAEVIVAGGAESMSQVPMFGHRLTLNPVLAEQHPDVYLPMGLTAENVAASHQITRQDQDAFAFASHQKALAALDSGRFAGECVPVTVREVYLDERERRSEREFVFDADEGPRRDTTPEKLATLKPAFAKDGSVTAGNSSQMSDGAAAVVLVSGEKLRALGAGARPLARFVGYAVGGVAPKVMGLGPVVGIPKVLRQAGLALGQLDLIELNEAFAAQALAVIQTAGLPPEKTNVNGGAIALGHPLGATGARLTISLLSELRRRRGRYGLVSLCVGGGMGGAGIFESLA